MDYLKQFSKGNRSFSGNFPILPNQPNCPANYDSVVVTYPTEPCSCESLGLMETPYGIFDEYDGYIVTNPETDPKIFIKTDFECLNGEILNCYTPDLPIDCCQDYYDSGPCSLCGSSTLAEWSSLHGLPTHNIGSSYSTDGSHTIGTTIIGGLASDGDSIYNDGSGSAFSDASLMFFPVVLRDFKLSYKYYYNGSLDGKHLMIMAAQPTVAGVGIQVGSWAPMSGGARASVRAGNADSTISCVNEYPDTVEIPFGSLPQHFNEWRTRTIIKKGDQITLIDGSEGPFTMVRCFFPVRGYVGLMLGAYIRVKDISLSSLELYT